MENPTAEVAFLRKQYLQLLDLNLLRFPPSRTIIKPNVQDVIFSLLFDPSNVPRAPPSNYQIRVLKKIVAKIEAAFADSEDDEISDSLMSTLATLLTSQQTSALEATQKKSYVTYAIPGQPSDPNQVNGITTLESRGLLASSGTTGFRTWEAALHLGSFLLTSGGKDIIRNKNVLELGAGTGFVSLLCANYLEAQCVLATDGDVSVVEDINNNIFLNESSGGRVAANVRIEASVYKWGHALLADSLSFHDEQISFDVVLGTDITYDIKSIPSLVSTLQHLFEKHHKAEVIIAAPIRNQETFQGFRQACELNKFGMKELDFTCPPIESQDGFFHSTVIPIIIISLKAPLNPTDPFAIQ